MVSTGPVPIHLKFIFLIRNDYLYLEMDNEKLIGALMGDSGYFKVYGALTNHFKDFCASGLLCKLISLQIFYKTSNQLVEGKWFYYTREQIYNEFYFSEHIQRGIIKRFEEEGLVETTIFKNSIPQKKYYSVNFDKLVEILSK